MTVQVFVTVGTSALSKFRPDFWKKSEDELVRNLRRGDAVFFERCKHDMVGRMITRLNASGSHDFQRYTAELGSLLAMKQKGDMLDLDPANNQIFLLHTDTTEGDLCAQVTAEAICRATDHAGLADRVEVLKIESLSVDDPKRFMAGLERFKELIQRKCTEIPDAKKILNITGGYKALIPYATVLAWDMIIEDMCYLYEKSDVLIVIKRPNTWVTVFPDMINETDIIEFYPMGSL